MDIEAVRHSHRRATAMSVNINVKLVPYGQLELRSTPHSVSGPDGQTQGEEQEARYRVPRETASGVYDIRFGNGIQIDSTTVDF